MKHVDRTHERTTVNGELPLFGRDGHARRSEKRKS